MKMKMKIFQILFMCEPRFNKEYIFIVLIVFLY